MYFDPAGKKIKGPGGGKKSKVVQLYTPLKGRPRSLSPEREPLVHTDRSRGTNLVFIFALSVLATSAPTFGTKSFGVFFLLQFLLYVSLLKRLQVFVVLTRHRTDKMEKIIVILSA